MIASNKLLKFSKSKGKLLLFKLTESKHLTIQDKILRRCTTDLEMTKRLQKNYRDIQENRLFSLEEIYISLGLYEFSPKQSHCVKNTVCTQKRMDFERYRDALSNLVIATRRQIENHTDKVCLTTLTHYMFESISPINLYAKSDQEAYSDQFKIGVLSTHGRGLDSLYKKYFRSSLDKKNDNAFCLEMILKLFTAIEAILQKTRKIEHIDFLTDIFYDWYFIKSKKYYDFMIFSTKLFDDLKQSLLDAIDHNKLILFIDNESFKGKNFDKLIEDEQEPVRCMDAVTLVRLQDKNEYRQCTSFTKIANLLEEYIQVRTRLILGFWIEYDCTCYNITDMLSEDERKAFEEVIQLDKEISVEENIKEKIAPELNYLSCENYWERRLKPDQEVLISKNQSFYHPSTFHTSRVCKQANKVIKTLIKRDGLQIDL